MTDHTPDYRTVGEHFLDFTITFFNLAKSKYQQQNQIKANSVGFQALILLNQTGRSAPTMSELDNCLLKLSGLLSRFNPDAPGAVTCPEFPSL